MKVAVTTVSVLVDTVTVHCGGELKDTAAQLGENTTTPVPVVGTAVRSTVPGAKLLYWHTPSEPELQLMPAGELVTVPVPLP